MPCQCKCKKRCLCEKDYVLNPSTCNYKNGKYLEIIMDDSAIMCDKVLESYDNETDFNEKKATQNFYILLAFSLITKAL